MVRLPESEIPEAGTLFDYDLALDLYYFSTDVEKGKTGSERT